jgi:hypothetical protein
MASEKPADVERGTARATTIPPKACSNDVQDAPSEKKVCNDVGDKLDDTQDSNRPKGVQFALLYLCILLGSFFIGYVRDVGPQTNCKMSS